MKTVCFAGHRPNKLGGYDENNQIAITTKKVLKETILKLLEQNENDDIQFISGAALGVDTWAADIVLLYSPQLILAIPHVGQQNKWPISSQLRWLNLFRDAREVHFCDKGEYAPYKMMNRNKWMVDNSDLVIAVWDGGSGGTANCIKYAMENKKEVFNLWPRIQELLAQN